MNNTRLPKESTKFFDLQKPIHLQHAMYHVSSIQGDWLDLFFVFYILSHTNGQYYRENIQLEFVICYQPVCYYVAILSHTHFITRIHFLGL